MELGIDASIEVVVSGDHGDDAATLLQRADVAMYVAKEHGEGVCAYDPSIDGHSRDRLSLIGDLRHALDRDELFLHFQPRVSIATGELRGAEALVRWQHPTRGLVPPDEFIPVAEHTALIGPLTLRVLDLAVAQVRAWLDLGHRIPVAVNLSARNLLDEGLVEQIVDCLCRHDVPADLLELDRSFVMTMDTDAANALIVRTVIDLGHNLGLTVTAEGVETPTALVALAEHGCDLAQGYHLCRPVTPEAVVA